MIKALRIVMIVEAALNILMGLGFIFFPTQIGNIMGVEKGPVYVLNLAATLGIFMIVAAVFIIIAAARDPLKHIMWVQFATTFAILDTAVKIYSIIRGYVTFRQDGMPLIVDAILAVALLVLYPWHKLQSRDQASA